MDRGAWWVTIHEVAKELNIATKQQQPENLHLRFSLAFCWTLWNQTFFLRLCFISKHSLGISSWHPTDTFNSTKVNSSRFPMTDSSSSGANGHSSPSHLCPNTGIFHNSVFSPHKLTLFLQFAFFPHLLFIILYKWPLDSLVWTL